MRSMIAASGTSISSTTSILTPAVSIASACGIVRGKPSNRKPLAQSGWAMRSLTRPMMMSSLTRPPESITFLAAMPSGVPALTAARSMSPVEICGMPYLLADEGGLRALAGARRAQQDQSHRISVMCSSRVAASYRHCAGAMAPAQAAR